MKKYLATSLVLLSLNVFGQVIENTNNLRNFREKLSENTAVTQILFLGDSHIQAGWIPKVLREEFQKKYGNAGRGTVFPYAVANSNGPDDYTSVSNKAWETFRLVYDQDVFPQVGALGFVMGNHEDSLLEISFQNKEDEFDRVRIFNDPIMDGEVFGIYKSAEKLKDYVNISKKSVRYQVQEGETFPELAAKFNIITTRLVQLNGKSVTQPRAGMWINAEQAVPVYNAGFEKTLKLIGTQKYTGSETLFSYPEPTRDFILRTHAKSGNVLYGFQFLKSTATKGVIFNTVGINGATYADFLKYPLQLQQLKTTNPDLVIISLGTNEAVSHISKEDFLKSAENLILALRKDNPTLGILLISPTDNMMNPAKTAQVKEWIREVANLGNAAFLDMYKATGGAGYFAKALREKKANADKVHFLETGYTEQGRLIWKGIEKILP